MYCTATGVGLLLGALLSTAPLPAGDLAYWKAGQPPQAQGLNLSRAPESVWRVEPAGTGFAVRLQPSRDQFTRAPYLIEVSAAVPDKAWLVVEYLDKGSGWGRACRSGTSGGARA